MSDHQRSLQRGGAVAAVVLCWCSAASAADAPKVDTELPWGKSVDGLVCRVTVQARYAISQPVVAIFEVKNISDKTRYIIPQLNPEGTDHTTLQITGPDGAPIRQTRSAKYGLHVNSYQPIRPGEVKRYESVDLRSVFQHLDPLNGFPGQQPGRVATGKYTLTMKFRSPPVPPRFVVGQRQVNGKIETDYKEPAPETVAGQWVHEIAAVPASFELAALTKEDFAVHEWGVFTAFNDVKYANVNRREEWGKLPEFFYRQFPQQRLRWSPSAWDKPLVYFYAKPTPLRVRVQVTFTDGAPVVWWPAAADPVDDSPGGLMAKRPRPFRSLTWLGYLGDEVPINSEIGWGGLRQANDGRPLSKVTDFPLPPDCWLQHARLPDASRLTVVGNVTGPTTRRFPGALDRPETERFIYYDGLVPAPDSLRCEQIGDTFLTLRNQASFAIKHLFIVDRRDPKAVGFWGDELGQPPLVAGAVRKFQPKRVAQADWPALGVQRVCQALLDAGLFAAEADSLLKIWKRQFFDADGVTAFYLLPAAEYDRMLPMSIQPAPPDPPVRVGIALHPHVEIEPDLTKRVAGLIRDLGDTKFEPRNAASKALLDIGPLAVGRLRAELKKDPPLEVRRRIEAVLERVDAAEWLALPGSEKNK